MSGWSVGSSGYSPTQGSRRSGGGRVCRPYCSSGHSSLPQGLPSRRELRDAGGQGCISTSGPLEGWWAGPCPAPADPESGQVTEARDCEGSFGRSPRVRAWGPWWTLHPVPWQDLGQFLCPWGSYQCCPWSAGSSPPRVGTRTCHHISGSMSVENLGLLLLPAT